MHGRARPSSETMSTFFARPAWLFLLLALPALAALLALARAHRRRALALLGQIPMVRRMRLALPSGRPWQNLLVLLGLAFLILACAGPQWGAEPGVTRSPSSDLVIVLDASRSMQAEQPSRLVLAARALEDLAVTLGKGGDVRIGLVLFAARPRVITPLTLDVEHLQRAIRDVQEEELPPEIWPGKSGDAVSGTRIGAALEKAVALLSPDPAAPPDEFRLRDIILLSDGDDPRDDQEYVRGAEAARGQGIPVHVVGLGDPVSPWKLRLDGQVVETRLQEKPLEDIARRTAGVYIPAHRTSLLPLGKLFREIQSLRQAMLILARDPAASRENDGRALGLPQRIARHTWFLLPAFLFLAAALVIPLRPAPVPPPARPAPPKQAAPSLQPQRPRGPGAPVKLALALLAIAMVSAAPLPSVEERIRQGNHAFHQGKFPDALKLYQEAESFTLDPGLVAFNKAAALFRMGDFVESVQHYRRCLEDGAILPARRARAHYDLGNALVRQSAATSARLLEQAAHAYRACLLEDRIDAALRADAAHNLEIARTLWRQALARSPNDPQTPDKEPNDPRKQADKDVKKTKDGPDKKDDAKLTKDPGKNGKDDKGDPITKDKLDAKDKKDAPGPLTVLLENVEQGKITPEESAAFLEEQARRIRDERRTFRREAIHSPPGVPNW